MMPVNFEDKSAAFLNELERQTKAALNKIGRDVLPEIIKDTPLGKTGKLRKSMKKKVKKLNDNETQLEIGSVSGFSIWAEFGSVNTSAKHMVENNTRDLPERLDAEWARRGSKIKV